MDTTMQAALLSWERTWADSSVVRGKARQLACCWRWQTTPGQVSVGSGAGRGVGDAVTRPDN